MEHEYTEASFALRGLKTTDLRRVQCLREVSTELDFDVFLAAIEKREEGYLKGDWYLRYFSRRRSRNGPGDNPSLDRHKIGESYRTSIIIKKLVDLDGVFLRSEMAIDEKDLRVNLIPGGDPFKGVDNRKEERYEGLDSTNPTFTHFYRTTVSCIPAIRARRRSEDIETLTARLGCGTSPAKFGRQVPDTNVRPGTAQPLLRYYAEKYLLAACEPTRRQYAVETMRRLARIAWGDDAAVFVKADKAIILLVLEAAVVCCEYDLFNDVLGLVDAAAVSDIFDLVRVSALAGLLDMSKICER